MKVDLRRRLVLWCDPNNATSRNCSLVCGRQEDHHHWAHSAMGRMRWGSRKEEFEVLGSEGSILGSRLEDLVIPYRGGVPMISSPFCLDIAESNRVTWQHSEEGSQVTGRGGRVSFILDMASSIYQGVEVPRHAVRNAIILTVDPPIVGCHGFEGPKHPVAVGNHLMMSWGVHPL